jgi:ABC-type uncharacterized transport system auxiliary subunit
MSPRSLVATIAAVSALSAHSANALTAVHEVQEVYPADGIDHATATKRALLCIRKFASSGLTTADAIISSDIEAGYIQARNAWRGQEFAALRYRTIITFEAKDGRFRITHNGFEVATDYAGYGEMNYPGNAVNDMKNTSDKIAACVVHGPVADNF